VLVPITPAPIMIASKFCGISYPSKLYGSNVICI
jgi:hypothetical protein